MSNLVHRISLSFTSALVAATIFLSVTANAAVQPNPPPSICINGKCTTTTTLASAIKWHPGHYGATGCYTRPGGGQTSCKNSEISMVRSGPAQVLGIEESYYWRVFENSKQGSYDFSVLDQDYSSITGYSSGSGANAVYNSPRRLIINMYVSDYFNADPSQGSVPDYILNGGGTYGPVGPDGMHTGYHTVQGLGSGNCGGYSKCGSAAAYERAAVMDRLIALMQALANHTLPDGYTVDSSPYVELVIPFLETATTVPQPASSDSTWSDGAVITQLQRLGTAMMAAFPHTNISMPVNYMGQDGNAATLVQGLPGVRMGETGPDTFGYSSGTGKGNGLSGLTVGQWAYVGGMGGKDLRGVVPATVNIQNTELVGEWGSYYQPCDIYQQANQTLHATHMMWQIATGMPLSGYASQDVTANWYGSADSNRGSWNASSSGGVLATIVNGTYCNGTRGSSWSTCPSSYSSGCNMSMVLPDSSRRRRLIDDSGAESGAALG